MADTARDKIKKIKPQLTKTLLSRVGSNDALHIARARKEAAAVYESLEMPMLVGHVWKRSRPQEFVPNVSGITHDHPFMVSRSAGSQNDVQFLAGSDLFVALNEEAERKGVLVQSFGESPGVPGQVVPAQNGFFEAMNQALWSTGVFVKVPAGVHLETPLQLNVLTDGRFPFTRLQVVLEEGASATLVERIASSSHLGKTVMVSEVILADGASLSHALVTDIHGDDTLHYSHGCSVGRGARLNMVATAVGSGRVKADLSGILDGERAQSEIRTFAVVQDRTAVDFNTRQHHVAPRTLSDMKSRSILLDKSSVSNTGLIRIDEAARDCEAYQISRNLMLSKEAQATAIPELEIENNDVSCSHGAATGTLDATQLFYLQSRGLSKGAATRLIVEGQLDEMLQGQPETIRQLFAASHEDVFGRLGSREA